MTTTPAPASDRRPLLPVPGHRSRSSDLQTLSPAYFALVMATGFVSVAALQAGMRPVAVALLWVNAVAYPVLWLLTLLRALWYRNRVYADLTDHQRGPGFFTAVAATCVLGSQSLLIAGTLRLAVTLWGLGLVLWVLLTYGIFTALIVKEEKPGLGEGITGAWLLAVVAALHLDDLADLLPLHVLQLLSGRSVAAVLDQHGRDGDLGAGRLASHHQFGRRAVPAIAPALPQVVHRLLLGRPARGGFRC